MGIRKRICYLFRVSNPLIRDERQYQYKIGWIGFRKKRKRVFTDSTIITSIMRMVGMMSIRTRSRHGIFRFVMVKCFHHEERHECCKQQPWNADSFSNIPLHRFFVISIRECRKDMYPPLYMQLYCISFHKTGLILPIDRYIKISVTPIIELCENKSLFLQVH